jgi:hypothetical protein
MLVSALLLTGIRCVSISDVDIPCVDRLPDRHPSWEAWPAVMFALEVVGKTPCFAPSKEMSLGSRGDGVKTGKNAMVVCCRKSGGWWSGWKCEKLWCRAFGESFTSHRKRLTFGLHCPLDGEMAA